jgi:hypothetical protein
MVYLPSWHVRRGCDDGGDMHHFEGLNAHLKSFLAASRPYKDESKPSICLSELQPPFTTRGQHFVAIAVLVWETSGVCC